MFVATGLSRESLIFLFLLFGDGETFGSVSITTAAQEDPTPGHNNGTCFDVCFAVACTHAVYIV